MKKCKVHNGVIPKKTSCPYLWLNSWEFVRIEPGLKLYLKDIFAARNSVAIMKKNYHYEKYGMLYIHV